MLPKVGTVRRAARAFCFSSRAIVFLAFAVLAPTLWTSCTTSVFAVIYFQQLLKDAYDMHRAKLSLHGKRGLLVANAFTCNYSSKKGQGKQ